MANDYLSGSQFGNVAGALLARRKKQDKDEAKKALFVTTLFETVGAFQKKQKTQFFEEYKDLTEKYGGLFEDYQSKWDKAETDRNALETYKKGGIDAENYLNQYAKEKFNNSNFAIERKLEFNDRGEYSDPELQKEIMGVFNSIKEAEKERLEKLETDPTYTAKTFKEFKEPLTKEFEAKLYALENDPTKRSLFKKALNKIFGYGAAEITELNAAANELTKKREARDNFINVVQDTVTQNINSLGVDFSGQYDDANINKYFKTSPWQPDTDKISSTSKSLTSALVAGTYDGLELQVVDDTGFFGGEQAEVIIKNNVLNENSFGLDGDLKLKNAQGEMIENERPEVRLSRDVAVIADYLRFNQNQLIEKGQFKGRQPKTDLELESDALRFLGKQGRFRRTGAGFSEQMVYIPLEDGADYTGVRDAFAKSLNLNNPTAEFVNTEYNVKAADKVPEVQEVFLDKANNERQMLINEYSTLIDEPEKNKNRILEIESRLDEVSEIFSPGNDQSYNKQLVKAIITGDLPSSQFKINNTLINLDTMSKNQKMIIYQNYLKAFNLQSDSELEELLDEI